MVQLLHPPNINEECDEVTPWKQNMLVSGAPNHLGPAMKTPSPNEYWGSN